MEPARLLVLLLVPAALLSGCTTAPAPDPDPLEDTAPEAPMDRELLRSSGSIVADAYTRQGNQDVGVFGVHEGTNPRFEVPSQGGVLEAELSWTSTGPTGLVLELIGPDGTPWASGSSETSPLLLVFEAPVAGTWSAHVASTGVAASADFGLVVAQTSG